MRDLQLEAISASMLALLGVRTSGSVFRLLVGGNLTRSSFARSMELIKNRNFHAHSHHLCGIHLRWHVKVSRCGGVWPARWDWLPCITWKGDTRAARLCSILKSLFYFLRVPVDHASARYARKRFPTD